MSEEKVKTEVIDLSKGMSEEDRAAVTEVISKAKEAEEAPEAAKEEEAPVEACPRCGFDPEGQMKPGDEDMREYTRSILGGRQFEKTYELMGGSIKLTFSTLSGRMSENLNELALAVDTGEDAVAYNAAITKYRLLYLVKRIALAENVKEYTIPDSKDIDSLEKLSDKFKEVFGDLDESVLQMVVRVMQMFRGLETSLITACFDDTFWTGAGPC